MVSYFFKLIMTNKSLQDYFRGQQVSLQWLPVLRAMALEMSAYTEVRELRQLFFKIGVRFAKDAEDFYRNAKTLAQLEESINDFWTRINWGWVNFKESDEAIDIDHQASPLAEAFGDEALNWSIGLLEGFYQAVFDGLGAGDAMVVLSVEESSRGLGIHLRYGRHAQ
jgi:hypothetical protein